MKNKKLREAFGIGEFDPKLRAKQVEEERRMRAEKEKELRQKRYQYIIYYFLCCNESQLKICTKFEGI